MPKKKTLIMNSIKVVFTIIIIYILATTIDFKEIVELYKSIQLGTIIICFFLYLLIYVLRALRFMVILEEKNFSSITLITLVHGMYNRILPFRLGEGSFAYLMKKIHDVSIADSLVSILLVRIFDLLSTIIFFVSVFILSFQLPGILWLLAVIVFVIAGIFCIPLGYVVVSFFDKKIPALRKMKISKKVLDFYDAQKNKVKTKKMFLLMLLSSGIWIIMFSIFNQIIVEGGLAISIQDIYLAGSFSNLSSILPISSVGNFGTMELGWSGILVSKGYTSEISLLSGFYVNTFTFSCTVLWGLVGVVVMKIMDLKNPIKLEEESEDESIISG